MDKIKTCLCFLAFTCIGSSASFEYTIDEGDKITLLNYVIETDDDSYKLTYPKHRTVYMMDVRIRNLTAAMMSKLESVVSLRVVGTELKIFHIIPQLEAVDIFNCQTEAVVIDPSGGFQLKNMTIRHGKLETLPKHLRTLTQLELLELRHNKITHVNTDEFDGLLNLRRIDLSRNGIVNFGPEENGVHLPRLESLRLSFNELTELNFEKWNATSLREVDFSYNRLTIATSLVSSFPELRTVRLGKNPLNCLWRDYLEKELLSRMESADPLDTCDEKSVTQMTTTNSKLDALISPLQKELQMAFEEINRLHSSNDDLTEAFYRYTLEQRGNSICENSHNQLLCDESIEKLKSEQIKQNQQLQRFEKSLKNIERRLIGFNNQLIRHMLDHLAQGSVPEDAAEE